MSLAQRMHPWRPALPTQTAGDHMSADVTTLALEPFTFRAPLDPYQIHQLPDFMIHSKARTDIVIQRAVFVPGAGPWHTHPGPSFVYVIEGEIKVERFNQEGWLHGDSGPRTRQRLFRGRRRGSPGGGGER